MKLLPAFVVAVCAVASCCLLAAGDTVIAAGATEVDNDQLLVANANELKLAAVARNADDGKQQLSVVVADEAVGADEDGNTARELGAYSWYYGGYYYNSWYTAAYNWYTGYSWYSYGGWSYYNWYSPGWYYSWYSPGYGGYYYSWYSPGYSWYYSWYTAGYNWYNDWYSGVYSWYNDWYTGYYYGGWYNSWYSGWYAAYNYYYNSWYSWYSWYGGGNNKFAPYSYYRASHTFTPGYEGYYYYYWYHYAEGTTHWQAKQQLGWVNWADVIEGAFIIEASSFIQTWKCHETTALTNAIAMSQYRKDVCSNGDRRWIFAKNDDAQHIVVDLGQERRIAEIGVEFGDAGERLPTQISFSYLGADGEPHDPLQYKSFGTVSKDITGYVKLFNSLGVTARYIRWDFQARKHNEGAAFMQLVAAGPPFNGNPSNAFVVLVVIIVVGLLVVGALIYTLSKSPAIRRRFYVSKAQIAKENAEFSSDSESSKSGDDTDSDSGSDSSSDDPAARKHMV